MCEAPRRKVLGARNSILQEKDRMHMRCQKVSMKISRYITPYSFDQNKSFNRVIYKLEIYFRAKSKATGTFIAPTL